MDGASVTNLHQKFPEASKWYKGEGDLSATAWVNPTSDRVTFAVAVKDDKFVAPAAGKLADGDAIELRVTDDSDQVLLQMMVGLVEGKAVAQQVGSNVQGIETALKQEGNLTLYRITAPRALIGPAIAKLHVSVMDNDEGYLKQLAKIKNRSDEEGVRFRVP
jgi:hypothetical protein